MTAVDWRSVLRQGFGRGFWIFAGIAAALAATCYAVLGAEAFGQAAASDARMLLDFLPRVVAAQLAAGFIWVLVPREKMTRLVERNSGRRGFAMALLAGVITPGGPASAFPLLAILAAAGADRGILVTYITSWALLGVQRIIVWDVPFMGVEFSVFRFMISLPLPVIAGLIARRLPFEGTSDAVVSAPDEPR